MDRIVFIKIYDYITRMELENYHFISKNIPTREKDCLEWRDYLDRIGLAMRDWFLDKHPEYYDSDVEVWCDTFPIDKIPDCLKGLI